MAYDGILEPIYVDLNTDAVIANPQITLPIPPASGAGEQTFRHATHAPAPFSAGAGVYVTCAGAGPAVIMEITLIVVNMDGTQLLQMTTGEVTLTPGVRVNVDFAAGATASIGTDLSYDEGAQKVVTAAGGVFMATLEVNVVYTGA